jgi:hypothetical protein
LIKEQNIKLKKKPPILTLNLFPMHLIKLYPTNIQNHDTDKRNSPALCSKRVMTRTNEFLPPCGQNMAISIEGSQIMLLVDHRQLYKIRNERNQRFRVFKTKDNYNVAYHLLASGYSFP